MLKDAQWILTNENLIGLVQADITGLIGDTIVDGEAGVVCHFNSGGGSSGTGPLSEVLLDHDLFVVLVNEVLSIAEEQGGHLEEGDEVETGTCRKEGVRSTAVFTFD